MTVWTYPAVVIRVVDADTLRLDLDLGLHIWRTDNCRLAGIDAPELNTPEGQAAKAYVAGLLPVGTRVMFESKQLDKYGRPLGSVTCQNGDLAQQLVAAGHVKAMP